MPIPGSGNDGNMTSDLAQFDLVQEIVEAGRHKPWPSGIHSTTLFKKPDFRLVLIAMETGARMKEHHVDGTTSVHVLKGHIRYTALGQSYDLKSGSLITLGVAILHEVESIDESAFLLTISWPGSNCHETTAT